MSNRRRSGYRNNYRSEYLCSPAWHARRDRWFASRTHTQLQLCCLGCGREASKEQLELHHLTYGGVIFRDGRWIAAERDRDLLPLHPYCHELLHRLIDRDILLSRHRDRSQANLVALRHLRRALTRTEKSSE